MHMDGTRAQSAAAASKGARPVPPDAAVRGRDAHLGPVAPSKGSGYGLPCAKCHLYYPANLDACPTCSSKERVSPVIDAAPPKTAPSTPDPTPDADVLEQEREEFLRQFKSQLFA